MKVIFSAAQKQHAPKRILSSGRIAALRLPTLIITASLLTEHEACENREIFYR